MLFFQLWENGMVIYLDNCKEVNLFKWVEEQGEEGRILKDKSLLCWIKIRKSISFGKCWLHKVKTIHCFLNLLLAITCFLIHCWWKEWNLRIWLKKVSNNFNMKFKVRKIRSFFQDGLILLSTLKKHTLKGMKKN